MLFAIVYRDMSAHVLPTFHRWGFVVFGAVDGFSRKIMLLRIANNNRSDTLVGMFEEAVEQHGLPSRVRSDKGGENRGVANYMVEKRGPGRRSHITGRSVHNQRQVNK